MRSKWIMMIFGVLLVGGATLGFAQYMKSYELDVTMMDTIKPARMIQAGELITEDKIRTISIPTIQHMENAVIDKNQLLGKRAVVPIGESEEFLSWKLTEDTLFPKEGENYYGFKVDFTTAVNNMVRRGDKVDVWVEYSTPKWRNEFGEEIDESLLTSTPSPFWEREYSKKIMEELTVAYVKDSEGKEVVDIVNKGPINLPGESPAQRDNANYDQHRQNATAQPSYITFILNDEEFAVLTQGTKEGTIKLGLPSTSVTIGEIVPSGQEQPLDTEGNSRTKSGEGGDEQ